MKIYEVYDPYLDPYHPSFVDAFTNKDDAEKLIDLIITSHLYWAGCESNTIPLRKFGEKVLGFIPYIREVEAKKVFDSKNYPRFVIPTSHSDEEGWAFNPPVITHEN